MAKILYKTKNNSDPKGKPRVYFTCHPEDFDRYFNKIWEDISATHDVALYYTEDMTEHFDPEHLETDLGQMNLIVVPVTFRLLTQPNRAMDADISYAKQKNIPILPFMMEQGIDEIYAKPEKFGERQYLTPYASDLTAIRYEEKLKKYLESVLISDELAQRVRDAFDAYIFLSYRKKDRKYANELMKLIHKNPECRDIAIWYDEFLTPGESFVESIQKALEKSKLFALLVTPNLLEEPDGKPNFVMAEEYPAAAKAEKTILPAEMVPTDHDTLAAKFPSIPDCSDPQDETAFKERLLQSLQRIAISANDNDPEHNFLIGLAYLEGIDVEVNRDRGIELITKAAEADQPEAMEKLYKYYSDLSAAHIDYPQALKWARRRADYNQKVYGENDLNTVNARDDLACLCAAMGRYAEAQEYGEQVYQYRCQLQGETHVDTLRAMQNLADVWFAAGKKFEAGNLWIELYNKQCKLLGKRHLDTLATLNKLAKLFWRVDTKDTKERRKRIHKDICELAGEILAGRNVEELQILNVLGEISANLHEFETAYQWKTGAYIRLRDALGEEHPDTINALHGLASLYFRRLTLAALQLFNKVYMLQSKVYGPDHANTLNTLHAIATCYNLTGQYRLFLKTAQSEYRLRFESQGADHPATLDALRSVGSACSQMGRYRKALECWQRVYEQKCRTLGKSHAGTLTALMDVAYAYENMDNFKMARKCLEEAHAVTCESQGKSNDRAVLKQLEELQQKSKKSPLIRAFERLKERVETYSAKRYINREDRKWMKKKGISHLL